MTESEWLASDDAVAMLLRGPRLLSPCCGCLWSDNGDGTMSMLPGRTCCRQCDNNIPPGGYTLLVSDRKLWRIGTACLRMYGSDVGAEGTTPGGMPLLDWVRNCLGGDSALKADLIRDIIGNPFVPVYWPDNPKRHAEPFDGTFRRHPQDVPHLEMRRAWLTPTVLSLSRAAHEELRSDGTLDPVRLAILADALEDAGCTDGLLLRHLRSVELCPKCGGKGWAYDNDTPGDSRWHWCGCNDDNCVPIRGPHVPGCWAIDLILGKE